MFFVISGFLITSILYKTKEPFWASYKKFIGRRTLRIFPLYYAVVLVLYILYHPAVHQYLFYFLTYTYNFAWVKYQIPANSASHFWSLSVEEQFYLFWPFIVLLLRKNENILITIIALLVIGCFVQMTYSVVDWLNPYNLTGLLPRAGSLGVGALGAILLITNKLPNKLLENKLAEYALFMLLIICLITESAYKYPFLAICSIMFVLKAVTGNFKINVVNNFLKHKTIIYIGSISYGIYIFHFPLGEYLTQYVFNPYLWNKIQFSKLGKLSALQYNSWLIKLPLYTFISIVLAHFSFKYFEQPILTLKDKFFKYS